MSWVLRALLYLVVVFLVMVVYAGQGEKDAAGVVRVAVGKTGKVVLFTAIIVVVMELISLAFLP